MRKELVILGALASLITAPALAAPEPSFEARLAERSVGEPVFDRNNFHVGTIAGYGVSGGTPAALVRLDATDHIVAISFQSIEPLPDGDGWWTALNAGNVNALWAWYPGTMDPAG